MYLVLSAWFVQAIFDDDIDLTRGVAHKEGQRLPKGRGAAITLFNLLKQERAHFDVSRRGVVRQLSIGVGTRFTVEGGRLRFGFGFGRLWSHFRGVLPVQWGSHSHGPVG